jgi:hypothetical protein
MTDRINIGDTVDVRGSDGAHWFGEVYEQLGDLLAVIVIRPGDTTLDVGDRLNVGEDRLIRCGVVGWPWREHDGCDDVDVTGRVRPYHRHAATGEAHAHPSGELAHTHQTREEVAAISSGGPFRVPGDDPQERMAQEIARYRFEHRLAVTARVTDDDRGEAHRILHSVLVGHGPPVWRLVRTEGAEFPGEDVQIAEEWTP